MVFPDHTACTDPGNIVGRAGGGGGGGGGGVQAHPQQVFSVINLIYGSFKETCIGNSISAFLRLQRGSNIFRGGGGGGGGVKLYPGGGGGAKYKNPNNL